MHPDAPPGRTTGLVEHQPPVGAHVPAQRGPLVGAAAADAGADRTGGAHPVRIAGAAAGPRPESTRPSSTHCFGGKEGLFRQAMEIPVEPQEVLARFEAIGTADELPEVIVRAFVDIWESPRSGPQMRALLRRALEDPERFGALVDFLSTAAVEPVSARLEGLSPQQARLRLTLVASHLLGTVVIRGLMGAEPLAGLDAERLVELPEPAIRADLALGAPPKDGHRARPEDDHGR